MDQKLFKKETLRNNHLSNLSKKVEMMMDSKCNQKLKEIRLLLYL